MQDKDTLGNIIKFQIKRNIDLYSRMLLTKDPYSDTGAVAGKSRKMSQQESM